MIMNNLDVYIRIDGKKANKNGRIAEKPKQMNPFNVYLYGKGKGCYANDTDLVEFRYKPNLTIVAVLEVKTWCIDNDLGGKYTLKGFNLETSKLKAKNHKCPLYLILYKHDFSAFKIYDVFNNWKVIIINEKELIEWRQKL